MATIFDYLKWRGDLSLLQDGVNEVDCLILSCLSYAPFDGLITDSGGDSITIEEAACHYKNSKELQKLMIKKNDGELLLSLGKCSRFKNMRLSLYINQFEPEQQKQFSAVTVELGDSSIFVSFRGTDETLVGWKEDFNMSFMRSVPSQETALQYLEKAAWHHAGLIRVGGHSKGGNLAIYSSAFCEKSVQDRIINVYNHDGPGLHADVVALPGYQSICDRIITFLPQASIVGLLLEHQTKFVIVQSQYISLLQHDPYSWEVMGAALISVKTVTLASRYLDSTIKAWLTRVDETQRSMLIDALYQILCATEVKTFRQLTQKWQKNSLILVQSLFNIDEEVRAILPPVLGALLQSATENLSMVAPDIPRLPQVLWKKTKQDIIGKKPGSLSACECNTLLQTEKPRCARANKQRK